jgi:imidazolonepropionase
MNPADLAILHAREVVTPAGPAPRRGEDLGRIQVIENAFVAVREGRICALGPMSAFQKTVELLPGFTAIDASGKVVLPGFVDPHTHVVFGGSREKEFVERLQGKSYQEIAAAGGGILSTVQMTRQAGEEELFEGGLKRLGTMLQHGTTAAEVKSGYGLDAASELKQLRVIRRLKEAQPVELTATFLGAHAVPAEFRSNRKAYIESIIEEMIPAVASERLARYCDVFCDEGAFTVEESRRILNAAQAHGLKARIHADELVETGSAELAAELRAASADHLTRISPAGIQALARSDVAAILLPGTTFFLMKHEHAPARDLISGGGIVALATDCNPGSSMTESMQMILQLACLNLRMTIEEAITAATLNAAYSLDMADTVGSIEAGRQADLAIFDVPDYRHLVYHFGVNHVWTVVKKGKIAYRDQNA